MAGCLLLKGRAENGLSVRPVNDFLIFTFATRTASLTSSWAMAGDDLFYAGWRGLVPSDVDGYWDVQILKKMARREVPAITTMAVIQISLRVSDACFRRFESEMNGVASTTAR